MSSGRQTKTIEFSPPDEAGVAARCARCVRRAADGSTSCPESTRMRGRAPAGRALRLLREPGGAGDDDDGDAAQEGAPRHRGVTVGIMHPTGGKAVARLAEAGVTLPEGWLVRQDHARRGLLVRTPVAVSEADVIAWCVRAGAALCRAEMTGRWRAVVYLPKVASAPGRAPDRQPLSLRQPTTEQRPDRRSHEGPDRSEDPEANDIVGHTLVHDTQPAEQGTEEQDDKAKAATSPGMSHRGGPATESGECTAEQEGRTLTRTAGERVQKGASPRRSSVGRANSPRRSSPGWRRRAPGRPEVRPRSSVFVRGMASPLVPRQLVVHHLAIMTRRSHPPGRGAGAPPDGERRHPHRVDR